MELDGHVGVGCASAEPGACQGLGKVAVAVYGCLIMMAPVIGCVFRLPVPPHYYSVSMLSPNESPCRRSLVLGARNPPARAPRLRMELAA